MNSVKQLEETEKVLNELFNQAQDKAKLSIIPPYNPTTDPENYEHVNYQGFPGQQYQKKSLKNTKGWIVLVGIIFWGTLALVILSVIL
jgi:hypothetical protein